MAPFALGSLGVETLLRDRSCLSLGVQRVLRCLSPLGALVLRAFYVTDRSWEPWSYQLVYVTARSW